MYLDFFSVDPGFQDWFRVIVLAVNYVATFLILAFCIGQIHLLWFYFRRGKKPEPPQLSDLKDLPVVTVQIPMYNERFVAANVIDYCARMEYPREKLELQVLDDSTDETVSIVDERAAYWRNTGIDITVIRRTNRSGYKAGALAEGTAVAKGSIIAIFDADFRPEPDFLLRSVPYFQDETVGFVQGRWGHLNKDFNLLTRAQTVMIDAFFLVEQLARGRKNLLIRFNGSGGLWRKSCVEASGGWQADTLSEDLDLCLRAQISGWKAIYDEDLVVPAELPVTMHDYRVQQYRWTKGRGQVIRKLFGAVAKAPLSPLRKFHALFDLLNVFVIPGFFLLAIASPFLLSLKIVYSSVILQLIVGSTKISSVLLPLISWLALRDQYKSFGKAFVEYLKSMPAFLFTIVGLSAMLCYSLVEGFFSKNAVFERTAKYNVSVANSGGIAVSARSGALSFLTVSEGALAVFFVMAIKNDISAGSVSLFAWHLSLFVGLSYMVYSAFRK